MANEDSEVSKKIDSFFKTAIRYFGKEVGLISSQHFGIDQICDPDKEKNGEFRYAIQYGFPQSGCVVMNFGYSKVENVFTIDKISVYAPPIGEDLIMASFGPQLQDGPISINVNSGMDAGTQEHTSISEIERNPNASKMLDLAITDLNQAQILGECSVSVMSGSRRIPCCNSRQIPNVKDKAM